MEGTDTKLQICLFSGDITRDGGTERVACFLANGLANNPRFDISVVSLTEQKKSTRFSLNPSIPRYTLSSKWMTPGPSYLLLLKRFIGLIKEKKFSIIIDVDIVLDTLSIPCKWIRGLKIVSWENFQYYELLGTSYRAWCRRFSCLFSDYIVTLTKRDAAVWKKEGRPRCPVMAIPNPADNLPAYSDDVPREKIILSVGRLVEIKGFTDIISIARRIVPLFPEWKFVIVGDGEEHDLLQTMIYNCGLENNIILVPFTSDIDKFYLRASVYLLTSRSEGLPMVLLEAKYYRLPSVSYDIINGPSDIILDGVNGYLVPPKRPDLMAEKLALLLKNDELRNSFSEHAWDNISCFSQKTILKQWTELLLTL